MKKLGFESKVLRGTTKYLITKIDFDLRNCQNKEDAKHFFPKID